MLRKTLRQTLFSHILKDETDGVGTSVSARGKGKGKGKVVNKEHKMDDSKSVRSFGSIPQHISNLIVGIGSAQVQCKETCGR